MARLNTQPVSPRTEDQRLPASTGRQHPRTLRSPSSSSAHSSGSDKENHPQSRSSASVRGKRSGILAHMPDRSIAETPDASKRRKMNDTVPQSQSTSRPKQFYDPEQDPEERRLVRKGLRGLFAKLHDSKTEFLRPDSNGLEDTLREADELYKNVKQTSEATIDSRLLVETTDLSYRKINNLTLGDGSSGIDVDDFITKCIGFMKRGDEPEHHNRHEPTSTQTQRRRARPTADLDEVEGGDEGDTLNWDYLGRNACFLYNARPCLTGFLLGPLSVQKKVRQQTQRKAREGRSQGTQVVRPVELNDEDLERQESASLAVICTEILQLLTNALTTGSRNVERECEQQGEDLADSEFRDILRRHGMADNGCVPLFNFCVNPKSFGQTVENLFYVSFLIKEGKVGLDFDSFDLPTLGVAPPRTVTERQETMRNQAIFTLDFDVWEDIIKSFDIEKSIIPHRKDEKYDDGTLDYAHAEDDEARAEEEDEVSDAYA